jgi:nucleotide-binding universal stress UspA family protein
MCPRKTARLADSNLKGKPSMMPVHTILHPTDFSRSSRPALELATTLARDQGARLIIVHVMPEPTGETEQYRDAVAQRWNELLEIKPADPRVQAEHRLERGVTVSEILRVARETKAGMIVMGTHGRKGWSRRLLGSDAETVLRLAPCPVVTVKIPADEAALAADEKAETAVVTH